MPRWLHIGATLLSLIILKGAFMSKKPKKDRTERYYDLKTDAVKRLVNTKNAPKVSDAEIRKYTSGGKLHIPAPLKIVLLKFWFSGAICYFFLWGLGIYVAGLDLMVILAVGLGISTDLMVNHILHSFEPEKGAYDPWMMFPQRKFWTFFANIIYAGLILFCVVQSYTVINTLMVGDVAAADTVAVGVEPILFGTLYTGFDLLFITMKNTAIKIFRDANDKIAGNK